MHKTQRVIPLANLSLPGNNISIIWKFDSITGLILGLRPANDRQYNFVTTSLIGSVPLK